MMKLHRLTLISGLFLSLFVGIKNAPVHAGIPVIDGSNLSNNVISALENITQTINIINSYQTQLQQFDNMLQNTLVPDQFIWDQAQNTINNLLTAANTLEFYQNQLGSIDQYLTQTGNVATYRTDPCITSRTCTVEQLTENRTLSSEAQKRANDAAIRSLQRQNELIQADATQLENLQSAAQGATGQLQAIGYANQLASSQTNQLMQIRALLVAQHTAVVTRQQAVADREAQLAAGDEGFRRNTTERSSGMSW